MPSPTRTTALRCACPLLALVVAGCDPTPARPEAHDAGDSGSDVAVDAASDVPRVYTARPFAPTDATRGYCGAADDAAIEARVTALLSQLTPAEKLQMMSGAALAVVERAWRVPGNTRLGVPGLRMLDGPRGLSAQARVPATVFPVGSMRGATWDPALERRVGVAIAEELRSVGADVLLAPTMNILRHPRWGRAQETYSEDTHHLGVMAAAFIDGAQSAGVLADAKHFAANSIENTRHTVDVTIDERTLREVYLPHFRRAVTDARVASVMSAYNSLNGQFCDLNSHLLTDVLRGDWGFAGFVVSDWVLGTHGDVASVRAGLDVEMPTGLNFRRLPAALASGAITEPELDEAVRRLLRAQLCYGLDARPRVPDDPTLRLTPAHLALAREVARRGIVLLQNNTVGAAPVLPIDAAAVRRIAVLGRNADVANIGDRGSSSVMPGAVVTALAGVRERAGAGVTVDYLPGATLDAAAQSAVRAADVVLVVTGLDADDEGESELGPGDRAGLELRSDEVALIRAVAALNPHVVVVLEGGAAITTGSFRDAVPALLFAFYPGSEGGRALADVLFGDAAPSGRLPFSIPEREADLPPFDDVSTAVTYGYFHGYRHLLQAGTAPAHAFGAGLTYTTFAWSDLALSAASAHRGDVVHATLRVQNTGRVRATETVQLYVSAPGSAVLRSPRDLRAFAQIDLAAGASAQVSLELRVDDLAYWDAARAQWVLEPLAYEVTAARDAAAAGLHATLRVE